MKRLLKSVFLLFLLSMFISPILEAQTYERDWRTDRQKIKIISYNLSLIHISEPTRP